MKDWSQIVSEKMSSNGLSYNKTPNTPVVKEHTFKNGKTIAIVKERQKYYLKECNGAFEVDKSNYVGGIGNKSKVCFVNESSALHRLNLMVSEDKKFVLKTPNQPAPTPPPPMQTPNMDGGDMSGGDMEMGGDQPIGSDEENGSEEDLDQYKDFDEDDKPEGDDPAEQKEYVQSLAGKLAYEIREYNQDDYSDVIKFAVNSFTAALSAGDISPDDASDILSKIQDKLESAAQGDEQGAEDMGGEMGDEMDMSGGEGMPKESVKTRKTFKEGFNPYSVKPDRSWAKNYTERSAVLDIDYYAMKLSQKMQYDNMTPSSVAKHIHGFLADNGYPCDMKNIHNGVKKVMGSGSTPEAAQSMKGLVKRFVDEGKKKKREMLFDEQPKSKKKQNKNPYRV